MSDPTLTPQAIAQLASATDPLAVVAVAGAQVQVVINLTSPPSMPSVTIGDVTASGSTVDAATLAVGQAIAAAATADIAQGDPNVTVADVAAPISSDLIQGAQIAQPAQVLP